jgi:hypothetical protein
MEVEFLRVASLTVGEPRVLDGVTDAQFQLVAQSVVPDNLFGVLAGIG